MKSTYCAREHSVLDGFARYTIELGEDSVILKTRKLYCTSEKMVKYTTLAPGYVLAKTGGLYGFPFLCYSIFLGVICRLLQEYFSQKYALVLNGIASISVLLGLVLFIVSHIRINKRAFFSYRDGGTAFRLKVKGCESLLQELCERIDRSHSKEI